MFHMTADVLQGLLLHIAASVTPRQGMFHITAGVLQGLLLHIAASVTPR